MFPGVISIFVSRGYVVSILRKQSDFNQEGIEHNIHTFTEVVKAKIRVIVVLSVESRFSLRGNLYPPKPLVFTQNNFKYVCITEICTLVYFMCMAFLLNAKHSQYNRVVLFIIIHCHLQESFI